MTKIYEITANQNLCGEYHGTDEQSAIRAYIQDAGYDSVEDCADRLDRTRDEILREIDIFEIDTDKLVSAVEDIAGEAVFQDSYGDGIALVKGQSYMTYRDLAAAFDLDLDNFRA